MEQMLVINGDQGPPFISPIMGDVTGREHEMHQTWWMIVSRFMDLNGFDHENCWRLP